MVGRTCAECGKFVPDDYLPDEGLVVKACEDCIDIRTVTIRLKIKGDFIVQDATITESEDGG